MTYESSTSFQIPEQYYKTLFNALPGNSYLLQNDAPRYTILAATSGILALTRLPAEALVGRGLFEAFPSNPEDEHDTGEEALRTSLQHVISNKQTHQLATQRYDVMNEKGEFIERYWKAENLPVFSPDGEIVYLIHTTEDITDQVLAGEMRGRLKGMQQAYNLFMQAPFAIHIFTGPDLVIELANPLTLELWGRKEDVVGKRYLDVLPELKGKGYEVLMQEVMQTGVPQFFYEVPLSLNRPGKEGIGYFNFVYQPYYKEGSAKAESVLIIANEVTQQVLSRNRASESEQRLELAIEIGELGVFNVDVKTGNATYSEQIADWFGLQQLNLPLSQVFASLHPDDRATVEKTIEQSLSPGASGKHDFVYRVINAKNGALRYLRSIGQVQYSDTVPVTISGIIQDETAQVLSLKKVEESEARFRRLADQVPQFIWMTSATGINISYVNKPYLDFLGLRKQEEFADVAWENMMHPDDIETVYKVYGTAMIEKKPYTLEARYKNATTGNWHWFHVQGTPRYDGNGSYAGFVGTLTDITERKEASDKLRESEARFRNIIEQAPIGFGLTRGEDMVFESINPPMLQLIARKNKADIIGKKVIDVLPELEAQAVYDILHQVFETGEPFHGRDVPVEVNRNGIQQLGYFNLSYTRIVDAAKDVFLLHMALDVTEDVLARKKLEEKEIALEAALEQLRLSKEAAELGTFDMNMESGDMHWDDRCRLLFGISHNQPVSYERDFIQRVHPDDQERVLGVLSQTFDKSASNGNYDVQYRTIGAEDGIVRWVRAKGKVYFDAQEKPQRFIGSVLDITEQKTALQKIEESQNSLLALFEESPVGIATLSASDDLVFESANSFYGTLVGRRPEDIIGKPLLQSLPELKGQGFEELLQGVIKTGIPFTANELAVNLFRKERLETIYVNLTYQPRKNAEEVTGILVVASDVTEQVLARKKIEESEGNLRSIVLAAPAGMCVIDAATLVSEIVNDSFIEIAGKPYEAIVKKMYWDAFAEARPYYEDALQGVIDTGTPFYANEVKQMLMRHGKEEIIYVTFVYMPLKNLEGKVTKVAIYLLEITPQVVARQQVEDLVAQRTAQLATANETLHVINKELHRSNQNLEEFAHAASHDLKEPVRKIHFFTNQLRDQLSDHANESAVRLFSRIENATQRMGNLIDDLLLYSHVSHRPHETEPVDLNEKVQRVLEDLELDIEEKKATINLGELPVVRGYGRQLQQLFQNLISNALKYSKADVPPIIEITVEEVEKSGGRYDLISVKDNGIGFAQEYENKIFQMFARLHGKAEYSGTGVGLSIVKKVVENHHGFIEVESVVKEGSVFKIHLPI